jgi:hypothetical protein
MRSKVLSLGIGAVLALAIGSALVLVSCNRDSDALPTGHSLPELPDSELGSLSGLSHSKDNESDDSESEDSASEDSNDDVSDDSDDDSDDDLPECAPGVPSVGVSLRGLISDVGSDSLTVNGQTIVVPADAEIFRKLNGDEVVLALADLRPGLPVKIKAFQCDDTITALRIKVPDEFEVTGIVTAKNEAENTFTIMLDGIFLDFVLDSDSDSDSDVEFQMGDVVDVEGEVPADLSQPFLAHEVEISN